MAAVGQNANNDQLACGYYLNGPYGHYNDDLQTNNLATFTTEAGQIIVFSFNNCQIILGAKK